MTKPPLGVIDGGRKAGSRPWRRRALDQDEQVTCHRCEAVHGVATSVVVKVVLSPRRSPRGSKSGGRSIWACAYCLARGEITELLRD
jgi:hypothetical protein